jgi:cell division protein ZapA
MALLVPSAGLQSGTGESHVAKTSEGVRVMIYDQEYNMKGELDPEYIQKLAKFLDDKMRSIAARTRTVDSLRVAVLAGLNLADEYHQLKAKYNSTHSDLDEKLGECHEMLDQMLKFTD